MRGYAVTHPAGLVTLPTGPGWDQAIYARSGLFEVRTDTATWFVPAHRALCVASGQQVRVRTRTPTAMRCLYTRRELGMPVDDVRVVDVEPLTRELLLRAVETAPLLMASPVEAALVTLLMAQLATDPTTPLHLPWPRDDRASRLADRVIAEPASSLRDAVAGAGASRRTLERRFRSETGMTLAAWRRRARLLAAIGLMSDGATVTQAATTVGYATSSAFTTAFRAELGSSPRRFMAADRSGR